MNALRLVPGQEDAPKAEPDRAGGEPPDDEDEEDESTRRRTNVILGLAVLVLVAVGIWLVNALLEQRRIDNCMAQGRRHCGQLDVPAR